MTTHFYKLGSPFCVVCGHDKRTDIEGTLTSMEFCKPDDGIKEAVQHEREIMKAKVLAAIDKVKHIDCNLGSFWDTSLRNELGLFEDKKGLHVEDNAADYCGHERPARKVFCQLKHPHKGSHRAIIYWED